MTIVAKNAAPLTLDTSRTPKKDRNTSVPGTKTACYLATKNMYLPTHKKYNLFVGDLQETTPFKLLATPLGPQDFRMGALATTFGPQNHEEMKVLSQDKNMGYNLGCPPLPGCNRHHQDYEPFLGSGIPT